MHTFNWQGLKSELVTGPIFHEGLTFIFQRTLVLVISFLLSVFIISIWTLSTFPLSDFCGRPLQMPIFNEKVRKTGGGHIKQCNSEFLTELRFFKYSLISPSVVK